MNLKKLDLDSIKKPVLLEALKAQADRMDASLRIIYDDTAVQVEKSDDKIMLLESQVSIIKHALNNAPDSLAAQDMLLQLSLTRREYASLHQN